MNELLEAISRFPGTKVLVLGDLMLDRYTWCVAERVSPEGPVLVLRSENQEVRLGGAASVAGLLRGLDIEPRLAGVLGDDSDARIVRALLRENSIDDALVLRDASRRTTCKDRFLGRTFKRNAQQVLRVDAEDRQPLVTSIEQQLAERILEAVDNCDVVLISDYAKGVCTPELLRCVLTATSERQVPVVIDPGRGVEYERYRGADIVKPNRIEAQEIMGRPINSPADAIASGKELCRRYGFQAVVVTLDSDGMVVCSADENEYCYPARIREVCDITGAGDTVLSILGACVANQVPIKCATQIANTAAGLQIERQGVAILTRIELSRQFADWERIQNLKIVKHSDMGVLASAYHNQGSSIVFTNGCFDLLHVGHVTYLQRAAAMGDVLIVAINSDASVRRMKGPGRPLIPEEDRAAMLAALSCVNHVIVFDQDTPHQLLHEIRPHVLVKGGGYTLETVVGREVVESYGGHVSVLGNVDGVSTSALVSRIQSI